MGLIAKDAEQLCATIQYALKQVRKCDGNEWYFCSLAADECFTFPGSGPITREDGNVLLAEDYIWVWHDQASVDQLRERILAAALLAIGVLLWARS